MSSGNLVAILLLANVLQQQSPVHAIEWLGLYRFARQRSLEQEPFSSYECDHSKLRFGVTGLHHQFCNKHPHVMHAVLKSAQAVAYFCPQTFRERRWNCSSVEFLPNVSPDLRRGTREQAVVYAMSSGAMLFEIARRCAMDRIANCRCGHHNVFVNQLPNADFQVDSDDQYVWNGCADNIESGKHYTRLFLRHHAMRNVRRRRRQMNRWSSGHRRQLRAPRNHRPSAHQLLRWRRNSRRFRRLDESEPEPDEVLSVLIDDNGLPDPEQTQTPSPISRNLLVRMLNGHNYVVGINIMDENRKLTCKCHGVSGSCVQKVCFRQLQRLDSPVLQQSFKQHYLQSKQVFYDGTRSRLMATEFRYGFYTHTSLGKSDLAFVEHSPDYCTRDAVTGSLGTHGRQCRGRDSGEEAAQLGDCDYLCCTRGSFDRNQTTFEACNCRLGSDFKVQCEQCPVNTRKYFCH